MNEGKELINFDNPQNIVEFLQHPIKLLEFITGILVSDKKDWILSASHLVQASIKFKLFSQLGKEMNEYVEKGKIEKDFLDIDQNKQSLSDLLKFIDESSPSEDRFNAMKTLFFKSVSSDSSPEEQIISYQFMKLCKDLESSELLILKAAYDIYKGRTCKMLEIDPPNPNDADAGSWLVMISRQLGHEIPSLVELNEDKLVNLKLIGPRIHPDRSGIKTTKKYRLTDLGIRICEYIYDSKYSQSV